MRNEHHRRGAVLVWVAMAMAALVAVAGLSIDIGWVMLARHQLQNAADAAALAGVTYVRNDPEMARSQAHMIGLANQAANVPVALDLNVDNAADGDIVLGFWDRDTSIFDPTSTTPNAVKVVTRRINDAGAPLFFGPSLGAERINVVRKAIAMIQAPDGGPGIILLRPSGPDALQISGNGTIDVDGAITVNSTSSKALSFSGNGSISATSFEIVGDIYQSGDGEIIGDIHEGVDPTADPYASLAEPDPSGAPLQSSSKFSPGGSTTLQPGRYVEGIDLSSSGTYTFGPGIYYMEGGGFKISSDATVNLNGVLIYNGHDSGGSGGDQIEISGDATINWTPLDSGSPYDGMSIFHSRSLSDKKVQISGNGNMSILGIIYAPTAEVQLSGNGPTDVLGGGFIAASMQISGDGSFNVGDGGGGAVGHTAVFLVE